MLYICQVPRISKYWLFQITGWLCFAFVNIYIAILTQEFSQDVLMINLLLALIGLLLSHLYRNYILSAGLTSKPTEKLLAIVTAAIMLLSVVYNLLYYMGLYLLYDTSVSTLDPTSFLGSFISVSVLFCLWSIIYFAWTYVENNRRNLIERLKMESAMKDLELKTIRSNLQPHFIFNALNSIRALIDENPALARKAITQISNILRSSITQQEITDTLQNELMLVNDYLALEKIRFEERLTFSKDIDPASLPLQIPTMMLQTLVENAVKHGISVLEQGGIIHIRSSYQHHILELTVSNTGCLKADEPNENRLGFGLNSTKQRLKLIYNNKASFDIVEKENMVHVRIKINIQ